MKKKNIGHYWKTIVAALGGVILIGNEVAEAVSTGYGDGNWGVEDTVTAVTAVAAVVGVWWKANGPKFVGPGSAPDEDAGIYNPNPVD